MKSVIKLGTTAAVSFVLGYVFSNQRNESYYLVEAQRAAEAIEEENEKIIKGLNKEIADLKRQLTDAKLDPAVDEFAADEPSEVAVAAQAALVDYQGGQREFYARHQKIAEGAKTEDPETPKTVSYKITEEEFRVNEKNHEQIPLMYYSGDNILATVVGDEIVEGGSRAYILGPYDISKQEFWDEYDALFLRNDEIAHDYEIDHVSMKFSEEVG